MTPEAELKSACRKIAKQRKLFWANIEGKGINGIPDTLVGRMGRQGVAFVEFKRPDGTGVISVQQHKRAAELIEAGSDVYFVNSVGEFLDVIEGRML